jgi:hypothetical protein
MTRIWQLADPLDRRFAVGSRIGTWEERDGRSVRVAPLVIEWEKGSTVIGDFVWPGFATELVVRAHIFKTLQQRFGGIEARPVQIVPVKHKPKRRVEDGQLHTWSNHVDLVDMRILTHVNADVSKTTQQLVVHEDGGMEYEYAGIEHLEWFPVSGALVPECRRVPRLPGTGIFVSSDALKGQSVFIVDECPAWNLCTDPVRDFILEEKYTNIDFFEAGELF